MSYLANPSGRRGSKWEIDSVRALRPWFPDIERRAKAGAFDKGDLINGPWDFTLENKDTQPANTPLALRQAKVEAVNAGTRFYAVLEKVRRSKNESGAALQGKFVMRIEQAAILLWERQQMIRLLRDRGVEPKEWEWTG